jgi:hypothetical protein
MWKSLTEYITALGHWGWVVLVDILSGGTGAYLDISGKWGFPTWLWLSMLGVALIIVPFIVFHKRRLIWEKTLEELNAIKNQRPEIDTAISKQNNDFDIEVLNKGEDAEFEAQVEIVNGGDFVRSLPRNYSAYWVKTKKDKTEIKKGHKDSLKIASLSMGYTPIHSMTFQLHYYEITYFENSVFPRIVAADSTSWIPGNTQVVKPCISLKITISSKPSMISGAFTRTYTLSDEGLSEANL